MRIEWSRVLAAVTAIGIAAPRATAEPQGPSPADAAEARAAFQRGRDLAKAGHHDEACPLFARSYELDPAPGTALNVADCDERRGQLRKAWQRFDQIARESTDTPSRASFARLRADALAARLVRLAIRLPDADAPEVGVRVDDHTVPPSAEIVDLVEPGDHVVVVTRPRQPVFQQRLHAELGHPLTVDVPPPAPIATPAPAPIAPVEPPITERRRSRVYLAGAIGVAGVAGLGTSLGLAVSAHSLYNSAFDADCTHSARGAACNPAGKATIDRAGDRADLATYLAIGGGALVAAGLAVFLTAPHDAIQIAPIASEHALGLGIASKF